MDESYTIYCVIFEGRKKFTLLDFEAEDMVAELEGAKMTSFEVPTDPEHMPEFLDMVCDYEECES